MSMPIQTSRRRALVAVVSMLLLLLQVVASIHPNEWIEVSSNVAFQRYEGVVNEHETNSNNNKNMKKKDGAIQEAMHRMIYSSSSKSSSSSSTPTDSAYANSMQLTGKEWNSNQLAWRLLGFYIDCSTTDKCQRMVLYAVYVDPNYEGGGFGEYEYYDFDKKEFVCYNNGSCRQKMDCHLTDTNWEMLGVFKINDISENNGWMEQLFKHEGVCVWGEDTYKFASNMRQHLPYQCKQTNVQDPATGKNLFYDVKPGYNATLTLGLYTDNQCSLDYRGGGGFNVFDIVGASESNFEQFNKDLETWRICQPCIAYSVAAADNNYYCYDEAGYENCNQCMKFSAKASCEIATARDIAVAERQQTLVPFAMYGTVIGGTKTPTSLSRLSKVNTATRRSFPFLPMCFLVFVACCLAFVASVMRLKQATTRSNKNHTSDAIMRDRPASPSGKSPKKKRTLFTPKIEPKIKTLELAEKSPTSADATPRQGKAKFKGQAPPVDLEWLSASRSRSLRESNTGAPKDGATNETTEKPGAFLGDVATEKPNENSDSEVNLAERIIAITRSVSDSFSGGNYARNDNKVQPFLDDDDQNKEMKPAGSPGAWIKGAMRLFKERRTQSLLSQGTKRVEV